MHWIMNVIAKSDVIHANNSAVTNIIAMKRIENVHICFLLQIRSK